ncbi:Fructosamine kinase-domain-containing protein [Lasiosphaeria ovina]|uniref:protein-ribulosamine 3-kinase n=1 Tax=Lasiosphaeria ovina TaxID=92902 RepID=A0AAE0KGU2_9PEZI|nr:Fructosamine kinase-domain-containing protein [Lasiosphaeria ovina]
MAARDSAKVAAGLGSASDVKLDAAVIAALPKGCRVLAAADHGVSQWGKTQRLDAELADGTRRRYFLKTVHNSRNSTSNKNNTTAAPATATAIDGEAVVCGEYESMRAIRAVVPGFAPAPVAWGTYRSDAGAHFILSAFRDMAPAVPTSAVGPSPSAPENAMPSPERFAARLAALHEGSESPPAGRFGFHVKTGAGVLPQHVAPWEDSWEVFFARSLRQALDLEAARRAAAGRPPWGSEMDALAALLFDRVIPRLLRPLESDGRSVRPTLVHGDLWHANTGVDAHTGESLVFDACSFYAHNEYEFGQWRPACNRFDKRYLDAYHQIVAKSEPIEDYDGRLDLYKLKFNTHVAALFVEDESLHKQMMNDIRDLVERYGNEDDMQEDEEEEEESSIYESRSPSSGNNELEFRQAFSLLCRTNL